ncbi:hypothetical protein [Streptomyces europaeiscabiei]|uniref:hypothetical protein n=1 Tax=Streptomyces europaeiscabiei TaxID=146819 RepID=UPI0029C9F651|nr:hypothetical protein [Streptomyces europaeiscabiei]
MGESETRSLAPGRDAVGLAEVFSLHTYRSSCSGQRDQRSYFFDTLAEYQWARDAAGLMPSSIDQLVKPVIELCEHYDVVPWQLTPTALDRYFAGPGKQAKPTILAKINKIDAYFAFLEQRYAGEIHRLFGVVVESPVDVFNRPRHRGDFGLRVPPPQRAIREFFTAWRDALPQSRKEAVACRDYMMAKIAYLSGVRAAELCGVALGDVHWESGRWGRFVVQGKGARGSGPSRGKRSFSRRSASCCGGTWRRCVACSGMTRSILRRLCFPPSGCRVRWRRSTCRSRRRSCRPRSGGR